jgi:methyl-accepting chemotaxis protein
VRFYRAGVGKLKLRIQERSSSASDLQLLEHRKVQEQQATITQLKAGAAKQEAINAELRKGMEALTATVKEQAVQIQKVSAQLEESKPAPKTVLNDE